MRRQATAVSSTPGLAKPCLMFFLSLCTRFIGIRYATYPEGKRCGDWQLTKEVVEVESIRLEGFIVSNHFNLLPEFQKDTARAH
jgi:hypothetical protein